MAETKRIEFIDLASGLLIIYMILEHIDVWFSGLSCIDIRVKILLTFYMPFFFFKSGMLTTEQSKIKLMKFLKPFLLTGSACYVITLFLDVIEGTNINRSNILIEPIKTTVYTGSFLIDNPTWFLLTLLIVKFGGGGLIKLKRPYQFLSIVLSILFAFLFYKLVQIHWIPQIFGNTCSGLCFYLLGYCMKDVYNKRLTILISLIGFIVLDFVIHPHVIMHWNTLASGIYLLWFPFSLFGVIICLASCKYISKFYDCKILTWYGNHAMYALCAHWPFLMIFSKAIMQDEIGIQNKLVLFISSVIFVFLFIPISNIIYNLVKVK